MTREEAIDWLARVKSNTVNHTLEMPLWWNEPLAEAFEMAIKELEQESSEDCVSRKAVIKAVDSHTFDTNNGLCLDDDISCILEELSHVTPTRKKGKWIRVDHNKVKCSKCEITHLIAQYPHGAINFCPNCGAEMESE